MCVQLYKDMYSFVAALVAATIALPMQSFGSDTVILTEGGLSHTTDGE